MQVDVHAVDAEIARSHPAHDRVEVGAVAIEVGAGGMHGFRNLDDLGFKQAAGVGIGQHDRRHVRPERRLERGEIDPAVLRSWDRFDGEAERRSGRRIGAVRRLGDEHDGPTLAARRERSLDRHQAAQLAVGARLRGHRHGRHAGELA